MSFEDAGTPRVRVLVLASRELAVKIKDALALPGVECCTAGSEDAGPRSLAELTSAIFPLEHRVPFQYVSFFEWGYYDYVILQDLWLDDDASPDALEAAGYVLAALDFMRGNFDTKKIVVLTDASYAWWRAVRQADGKPTDHLDERGAQERLVERFDRKGAWAFMHLTEDENFLCSLRALVHGDDAPRNGANGAAGISRDGMSRLYAPVMDSVDRALRAYIQKRAEVIIVDDDPDDLGNSLAALNPGHPQRDLKADGQKPGEVTVASVKRGILARRDSFEGVRDDCVRVIDEALRRPGLDTILVVDVLLNVTGRWRRTGLDLLGFLRKHYAEQHRLRMVVFTGFSTPSITMSAYQRGADFVVHKSGSAGESDGGYGSHDPIVTEDRSRLVMTLALMCFQKEFLRGLRRGLANGGITPGEAVRILASMAPKHTLSLHMQPEWEDTRYLVGSAQVYGPASDRFKLAYTEIVGRYGGCA